MAAASNAVQARAFPSDSISRRDCNCFHMGLVESECTSLRNDNAMYMQCLCIHAMYTVHCTGHVTFNDVICVIAMIATCNNINRKAKSGPVLPFV